MIQKIACNIQRVIESQIHKKIKNKQHQEILLGILLGNDEEIEQEVKENFNKSSLSHILAVSGMHVAYITIILEYFFSKLKIGKRKTKRITILFLIFFMMLTNNTPSVRRACIMAGLSITAFLINQKSDIINNMAISLLITLLQNPFSIWNTGLILSYSATLAIILLTPIFLPKKKEETKKGNYIKKIQSILLVSISAQIGILPIYMLLFQSISFTFFISNLFVSFIIGSIILVGFMVSLPIKIPILPSIAEFLLSILIAITKIFSKMPFSHMIVCSPHTFSILLYYAVILLWIYNKQIKRKKI